MITRKTGWLVSLALWFGLIGASPAAEPELYAAAHAQQSKTTLVMMGTVDTEGFPQTRVMSNLRFPERAAAKLAGANDFTAYAVTRTDSEKLKHLAKNKNMSMYYQSGGQGLLLMGQAEIVTDPATRRAVWDDSFKQMGYANANDPTLTILRFTPTHGKFYYRQKQHNLSL